MYIELQPSISGAKVSKFAPKMENIAKNSIPTFILTLVPTFIPTFIPKNLKIIFTDLDKFDNFQQFSKSRPHHEGPTLHLVFGCFYSLLAPRHFMPYTLDMGLLVY